MSSTQTERERCVFCGVRAPNHSLGCPADIGPVETPASEPEGPRVTLPPSLLLRIEAALIHALDKSPLARSYKAAFRNYLAQYGMPAVREYALATVAPQTPASTQTDEIERIVWDAVWHNRPGDPPEEACSWDEALKDEAELGTLVPETIRAAARIRDHLASVAAQTPASERRPDAGPRVTLEQVEATLNDEAQRLFSNHPQGTRDRVQGLVNATIARLLSKCRKPARQAQ